MMKKLQIFQVDAFAKNVFEGNPAAVCQLDEWLNDELLLKIAQENNLAETAFFVELEGGFHIRWFTPTDEVPLCGHATLASAFVILTELEPARDSVSFESKSGPLYVRRQGDIFVMDFPKYELTPVPNPPEDLIRGLGVQSQEVFVFDADPNYYVILPNEDAVRAVEPDMDMISRLHPYGVVITAPGERTDCVSRCFAPSYGIPEDQVTGSIHCALVPYWAERLKKSKIHAYQASKRGGDLYCELDEGRVLIGGYAVKFMTGNIFI